MNFFVCFFLAGFAEAARIPATHARQESAADVEATEASEAERLNNSELDKYMQLEEHASFVEESATVHPDADVEQIHYSFNELTSDVSCGQVVWNERVSTGFEKTESSSSSVSAEVSASITYASGGAVGSASAKVGAEYAKSVTTVSTSHFERTVKFASPNGCGKWYLLQSKQAFTMTDKKRYVFYGSPFTSNRVLSSFTVKAKPGIQLASSWRKAEQQYLVTRAFKHGTYFNNQRLWKWWPDDAGFYVFINSYSASGLEAVYSFRKDERQFLTLKGNPDYEKMGSWGWSYEDIAFYAWPVGKGPAGAQKVHQYRKGQKAFYCLGSWPQISNQGAWGWRFEMYAFEVPESPF